MRDEDRVQVLEQAMAVKANPAAPPNVLANAFAHQLAFVKDPARLKAAFCTRRAAKSYSFGLHAVDTLLKSPNATGLYVALTREEAERIFWEPVLKDINRRHKVGMDFNETKLRARLPNGSRLYVLGADANEEERKKMLGQKFDIVGIDEAQAFRTDLHQLVYEILKPAVADNRGTICMLGTPGLLAKGLFFDVTTGKQPGWSLRTWSAFDNPYIADNWRAEIEELKATHPGIEETPSFRRNYLGEWVVEESALVYRYAVGRNDFPHLPELKGTWRFVLGCDLGHEDATAWVVCAYHEHDKTLYVLDVQKESGLDITSVARRTEALRRAYDFDVLVVDGANKQAVEEMRNRHGIPWTAADKTGKEDFIELMNGDFLTGHIKLSPSATPLAEEYRGLIWDERKLKATGKRAEHAACDNHAADAALYAWRYCYSYLSEAPAPKPVEEDAMEMAAEERWRGGVERETTGVGDSSQWEAGWKWK